MLMGTNENYKCCKVFLVPDGGSLDEIRQHIGIVYALDHTRWLSPEGNRNLHGSGTFLDGPNGALAELHELDCKGKPQPAWMKNIPFTKA
jgi:hypothetical protein